VYRRYLGKGTNVRVLRGDKILFVSKIKTLRNFKAETDRIEEGNKCGVGLLDYDDFPAGDFIACHVV
jgi:translation initiation factor IF-2